MVRSPRSRRARTFPHTTSGQSTTHAAHKPTFCDSLAHSQDTLTHVAFIVSRYFPNEPFILKGAAKSHAAYKNWQSDEYIVKNFGHYKAKAENKNEDRLTDYCGMQKMGVRVDCPRNIKPYEETYINISRFMKHYRKPGYDKYIISQLPDGMADEVCSACDS